MINFIRIPGLANPFALWNPFAPVDWLVSSLNWLAGQFFTRLWLDFVWVLTCTPPALGYFGYIIFALWLTRWVTRHVPMLPLNPQSPIFYQLGGARLFVALSMFDLMLYLGGAGIGAYIPSRMAVTIWYIPLEPEADTLGPIGRIAELVGLVCGFRIAMHCRFQINLLIFVGLFGYFGLSVAEWVLGS